MLTDFLILMKHELIVSIIIFALLIIKIGKDYSNETVLKLVDVLLVLNFAAGVFFNQEGGLFTGMFTANKLIAFEKNILNLGILIISMQSYQWLKNHKHVLEFYILLLSTLLGMFF